MTTLHYRRGAWSDGIDPTEGTSTELSFVEDDYKSVGYRRWLTVGEYPYSPLVLTVYLRKESPRFLVNVEGNQDGEILHVFAEDLADVMDLLGQWTAVAQSTAMINLIAKFDYGDPDNDDLKGLVALLKATRQS